jgi:hypothetical protein
LTPASEGGIQEYNHAYPALLKHVLDCVAPVAGRSRRVDLIVPVFDICYLPPGQIPSARRTATTWPTWYAV